MLGQSWIYKNQTARATSHVRKSLLDKKDNVILASAKITLFYGLSCQIQGSPGYAEFAVVEDYRAKPLGKPIGRNARYQATVIIRLARG